jgi:hypothetical protein
MLMLCMHCASHADGMPYKDMFKIRLRYHIANKVLTCGVATDLVVAYRQQFYAAHTLRITHHTPCNVHANSSQQGSNLHLYTQHTVLTCGVAKDLVVAERQHVYAAVGAVRRVAAAGLGSIYQQPPMLLLLLLRLLCFLPCLLLLLILSLAISLLQRVLLQPSRQLLLLLLLPEPVYQLWVKPAAAKVALCRHHQQAVHHTITLHTCFSPLLLLLL